MKIEFIANNEETFKKIDPPEPASKFIPDWYKESFTFKDSNSLSFNEAELAATTIKACMPVLDSITAGYIQKTWCDINIERKGSQIIYHWSAGPEIISIKPDYVKQKFPIPHGYSDVMFNWRRYWFPKTPKGYSVLLTHPMYRTDLPFICLPGIIDSDSYYQEGNSPAFFIADDFEGLIPKGTPMFQMIPFKRDSWDSSLEFNKYKDAVSKQMWQVSSRFSGSYKKIFWKRKQYN
jgi:hypothetical protein